MAAAYGDELICDMAETYHVLNWRELPPRLAATLADGLPEDSRVRRRLNGEELPLEITLLAAVLDQLRILCWMKTADARKGRNRPKLLTDKLRERKRQDGEPGRVTVFRSPEDFEAKMREITGGAS
jgi:hypothetical protein